MDRRTVDEDLDDLTLDVDLETDMDAPDADSNAPRGVMAPPSKRTATRKPPVRKTASGGSGNAPGNGKGNDRTANNGSTGSTGGKDSNSGTGGAKSKAIVADGAVADTAVADGAAADSGAAAVDTAAADTAAANSAAPAAPAPGDEPTVVVSAVTDAGVQADDVDEPAPTSKTAKGPDDTTEVLLAKTGKPAEPEPASDAGSAPSKAVPAMPADDIWAPRSGRTGSGSAASWAPVEASARPRGNAFEMNDAFSAPPMPSESRESRTPASTAFSSPASTSASSTSPAFSSASSATPASTAPASTTPAQGFPRSASTAKPSTTARPAAAAKPPSTSKTGFPRPPKVAVRRPTTGRQAHLTVARVEPWSVMKFSFALSAIAFVVLFVAVAVLYVMLSALGVFDSLQHLVTTMTSSQGSAGYNVRKWFSASRVFRYAAMLGGFNVILITAMSTIGAVVYNLTSRLIGGVEVTLKETD